MSFSYVNPTTTLTSFTRAALHGPHDFVLILDRSTSIGPLVYHLEMLPFVNKLVKDYLVTSSDKRVAIVAFNGETTLLMDTISGTSNAPTKCSYLGGQRPTYEPSRVTDLTGSLRMADKLLVQGHSQRPLVKQIVLIITDGAYRVGSDEAPDIWSGILKRRGRVHVYSVEIGVWSVPQRVLALASDIDHYASFDVWTQLSRVMITSYVNGNIASSIISYFLSFKLSYL